jgi:hypothetical protein
MTESIDIYSQAKVEYTKQLVDVLKDRLYDGYQDMYIESKKNFKIFRKNLEKVIQWNQEMIELEKSKIVERSKCEWIDDLITAVFISHTRILTSIGNSKNTKRVNLVVPKTINFIHKCYINSAREFWKNPNLFDNKTISSEYQKNIRIIDNIIINSIEFTIRSSLPVKDILQNHLSTNAFDEESKMEELDESSKQYIDELNYKDKQIEELQQRINKNKMQIDNSEPKYDNDKIFTNDNEQDMIKNIIEIDEDNKSNTETVIEEPNDMEELSDIDIIDDTNVVVDNYDPTFNLFDSIENKEDKEDKEDKEGKEGNAEEDGKIDEEEGDIKIISDLQKTTSNDIKGIKKISNDNETRDDETIDDNETIDDLLSEIDDLNKDNTYTLYD